MRSDFTITIERQLRSGEITPQDAVGALRTKKAEVGREIAYLDREIYESMKQWMRKYRTRKRQK